MSRRVGPRARRVGSRMAEVEWLVQRAGGRATRIDVARSVGPHGSVGLGYAIVERALAAGLVELAAPLPGRRGLSLRLPVEVT